MTTATATATTSVVPTLVSEGTSGRNRTLSGLPVEDVTVIIGYKTKEGRQEVMYDIAGSDFHIVKCNHSCEEKVKQTRDPDTKQLMGYESTGEYSLKLDIKYVVPNP